MAALILDTGVLVALARGSDAAITEEDDVATAALAVAEFLVGLHLDVDAQRRERQRAVAQRLFSAMSVFDYTLGVAEHHAELMASTRREGRPRGAHDLIIAATARATGRTLVTTDARAGFEGLPGVDVRVVAQPPR